MPPFRMSPRKKAVRVDAAQDRDEREVRVQQALAQLASGQYTSIGTAAVANNVPKSTLYNRSKGRLPKRGAHSHLQALLPAAEQVLKAHIERCAGGGFPLTPSSIHNLAETAMQPLHHGQRQIQHLGKGWLSSFLLRHPDLDSKFSRCLDNARMKAMMVDGVKAWFNNFSSVIGEYELQPGAIFNMDETGFMMGVGGRQRVVVPNGPKAARFKAQAGNRESTTVIECIGSGGQSIAPMVIFKGKWHMLGDQRRYVGVAADWAFGVSANGWTSCDLAVLWMQHVFDPATEPPEKGRWRMLVLDGHASHVSVEFLDECWRRRVVPMCLPPHSTHLMQPLDVSIFGPLTDAYRRQVTALGDQANKVDWVAFANMYVKARAKTITARAARKAFADCGMTTRPDAKKVLLRLPGYVPALPAVSSTPPPATQPPAQTPTDVARFRTMLEELIQTSSPQEQARFKDKLIKAYDGKHAGVAIWERHEEQRQAALLPKRTPLPGDRKMLSKERMILRAEAELLIEELERVVEKETAAKHRRAARQQAAQEAIQDGQAVMEGGEGSEDDRDGSEAEDFEMENEAAPLLAPVAAARQETALVAASDEALLFEAAIDPLLWPQHCTLPAADARGDLDTQAMYADAFDCDATQLLQDWPVGAWTTMTM